MATINTINNLVINNVESQEVYDLMLANNMINENELYLVNFNIFPNYDVIK